IGATADAGHAGYWEKRGWDSDAFLQLTSQIILPRSLQVITAGRPTPAGGVAYSGDKGISRVELSLDGGKTWSEAMVSPGSSAYAWVLWTSDIVLTDARQRKLIVRAYDANGAQQTAVEQDPPPAGATGLQTRVFFNVKEAPA